MGWDGSGNVIRDNGTNTGQTVWQDDADASVKIRADRHDNHDQDLAGSIENTVALDGQTTTTVGNSIIHFDTGSNKFVGLSIGTNEIVGRKSGDLTTYVVGKNDTDIPQNSDIDSRGFAQQVASVSALQSGSYPASLDRIWLSGYYGVGTPGGGPLYRDSADTTTADNGGTVFVDADGVRWKRPLSDNRKSTVFDFGAVGDGSTDDRDAIAAADSAGAFRLTQGSFRLASSLTVASNITVDGDAELVPDSGVTVTVNGLVTAYTEGNIYGGDGTVTLSLVTLSVPGDYATIQEAVDAVPKRLLQEVRIEIADGTYNEDVLIDGIFVTGAIPVANAARPRLSITGAAGTNQDPNVRVRSFMAVGCMGSNSHPGFSNMTVFDHVPWGSNEASILVVQGSGEVKGVSFAGNGVTYGVFSYAANVMVSNCDFGASVNEYAMAVKHSGTLHSQTDNTGIVTKNVFYPDSGYIQHSKVRNTVRGEQGFCLTSVELNVVSGIVVDHGTGRIWNTTGTEGLVVPRFHTRFESLSGYVTDVSGGNTTVRNDEGLRLETAATNGNYAGLIVRRSSEIATGFNQFSEGMVLEFGYNFVVDGGGQIEIVIGAIGDKSFGFRFDGTDLIAVSNDGTSETTSVIESSYPDNQATMKAILMGDHIEFYEKGDFKTTITTNLPSGSRPNNNLAEMRLTAQSNNNNILYIGEIRTEG